MTTSRAQLPPEPAMLPGAARGHRRWGLRLATAGVAIALAAGTLEFASYVFFRSRDLLDRDLRVFRPAPSGGMPVATRPHFSQRWNTGQFDIQIRTNGLGLREDFELPPGQRVDVGFLGDSFTFGHGVEAGERYSDRVREAVPGRLVVSYGYLDGFTTPHYHLFLKEHPELIPRVAVVGLYLTNDLGGDMMESELVTDPAGELLAVVARYRAPDELGRLVTRDANPVNAVLRRSWSGRFLLYVDRQLALNLRWLRPNGALPLFGWIRQSVDEGRLDDDANRALDHLDRLHTLVQAAGGRTVVLLIPPAFYIDARYATPYPADVSARIRDSRPLIHTLQTWCAAHGIPCVDPVEALRATERDGRPTYFSIDPHWTPTGHRAAASAALPEILQALAS